MRSVHGLTPVLIRSATAGFLVAASAAMPSAAHATGLPPQPQSIGAVTTTTKAPGSSANPKHHVRRPSATITGSAGRAGRVQVHISRAARPHSAPPGTVATVQVTTTAQANGHYADAGTL